MIWKSLFSAVAILAHILLALAAPTPDSDLTSQASDKYVFAHFMVSTLAPDYFPFRLIDIDPMNLGRYSKRLPTVRLERRHDHSPIHRHRRIRPELRKYRQLYTNPTSPSLRSSGTSQLQSIYLLRFCLLDQWGHSKYHRVYETICRSPSADAIQGRRGSKYLCRRQFQLGCSEAGYATSHLRIAKSPRSGRGYHRPCSKR